MPFSAFFPAGKADPTLIDRLTSQRELQGLLRASVGGLQQVMRRGSFTLPASVTDATRKFKMEADPLRGFIEERIEFKHEDNAPFTPRTDVYTGYTSWAVINGFHQMSAQRFYESFMAAAVDTTRYPLRLVTVQGVQGYRGLQLR